MGKDGDANASWRGALSRARLQVRERRNAIIGSPSFRKRSMRWPLFRAIARKRARALFDLTAGFTYTQATLLFVESGVGDMLRDQSATIEEIRASTVHGSAVVDRIVQAALGVGLVVRHGPRVALSDLGVALMNEPGILAMVRHHAGVYRDLADPLSLLQGDRPTETSAFWQYAGGRAEDGTDPEGAARYSELMAVTQGFVTDEVIASYRFADHRHVVDVGGGSGAFAARIARASPDLAVTVFDLPDVAPLARDRFASLGLTNANVVAGSFHEGGLPGDGDLYTLIRVLYDHDDEPALAMLRSLHAAMPDGATLLIAEPMAGLRGAETVGTYFELYLAAMRSGRCRSPARIRRMLAAAGFERTATVGVGTPVFTGMVMARK